MRTECASLKFTCLALFCNSCLLSEAGCVLVWASLNHVPLSGDFNDGMTPATSRSCTSLHKQISYLVYYGNHTSWGQITTNYLYVTLTLTGDRNHEVCLAKLLGKLVPPLTVKRNFNLWSLHVTQAVLFSIYSTIKNAQDVHCWKCIYRSPSKVWSIVARGLNIFST